MDDYITLFHKFIDFINWETLQYSTFKLNTDFKVSKFFTKDHLESMIYFHIAEHKGLRDLKDSVSLSPRLKHLVKSVSLGTLSNHNNKRNYEVFMPVMIELISKAFNSIPMKESFKKFGPIKLIDFTTISMCLTFYKWALFRKKKAGVKMHLKFDLNKGLPECFIVTNAKNHDKTKMEELMNEKNCIYIFDKAYVDYKKFDRFTSQDKYFVTRLKDNAVVNKIEDLKVTYAETKLLDDKTKIISDQVAQLGSADTYKTKKHYRVIKIIDSKDKELVFVINIFDLSSEEIAWLYKKRWEIELFFKWIKQNLKFKTPIGHSLNAIMIQIITGIMTFVMLKLVEKSVSTAYGLLQIKRKIKHCLNDSINSCSFEWNYWLESG